MSKPRQWRIIGEEKAFIRERKRRQNVRDEPKRKDKPVWSIDRTDPVVLFGLKDSRFGSDLKEALGAFLNRHKRNVWMQKQHGYVSKVALALSSNGKLNAIRFANCRPGLFCGETIVCPQCDFEYRVKPAEREYGKCFNNAPYWLALSPSVRYSPQKTGLHFVLKKRANGKATDHRHELPFSGKPERRRLSLDPGDADAVRRLLTMPFQFAKALLKRGLIDGAYVVRDATLEYHPNGAALPQLQVDDVVYPHGHALANSRHKPDWRFAKECWQILLKVWERLALFELGYPDLEVGRAMRDQAEINRWLSYTLKPMMFHKFWHQGIRSGCNKEHLSLHFDQTLFWFIKELYNGVRSPRKMGNMNSDPHTRAYPIGDHRRYLGNKPQNRMVKRILGKIRRAEKKDPPEDPFDSFNNAEIAFLANHHLDGRIVTIDELTHLDREL